MAAGQSEKRDGARGERVEEGKKKISGAYGWQQKASREKKFGRLSKAIPSSAPIRMRMRKKGTQIRKMLMQQIAHAAAEKTSPLSTPRISTVSLSSSHPCRLLLVFAPATACCWNCSRF